MKTPTKSIAILISVLIAHSALCQEIVPDACVEFLNGQCTRCKKDAHLYQGICYRNIMGCLSYQTGDICDKCDEANFRIEAGTCMLKTGNSSSSMLKLSLSQFSGSFSSNPGDQYGETSFNPSSVQEVKDLKSFQVLDSFIRKGQYGHYISRIQNPIFSVHYYQKSSTYSYKIIYFGSGGGLFLCIADVPTSMAVQLRSLTPISASNIIDNCFDYDSMSRCVGCKDGNHLESGKCYQNYGGCLRYVENLCVQCLEFYFLVENRCVSDCFSSGDSASILSYQTNQNLSTLQQSYNLPLQTFFITLTSSSSSSSSPQIKTIATQQTSITKSQMFKFSSQASLNQTKSILYTPTPLQHLSFYKQAVMPATTLVTLSLSQVVQNSSMTGTGKSLSFNNNNNLCLVFEKDGKCKKCVEFYFLNAKSECQELSSLCVSIDSETGVCIQCFTGSRLLEGRCGEIGA